jgi:ABC-type transport system involved in cytochrome c biogenesis permease subunit
MNGNTISTAGLAAAAGFYLASWLALLGKRDRAGWRLMGVAWTLNAGLVAFNGWIAGGPPFGNMYHVQTVMALCFAPLCLTVAMRGTLRWTAVYFAFAAALPLIGALCMGKDLTWRRMPALQSPWFVPHVLAYMVSYSLAAVAFVLALVGLAMQTRSRVAGSGDYEFAVYETLRLAFPFMTFGLLSGALWAEEAWGAWWSWDPKETWSLMTWMLYVIYFHCRATPVLRPYAQPAHVLAFMALLVTFFLVNLLPRLAGGLHSYA